MNGTKWTKEMIDFAVAQREKDYDWKDINSDLYSWYGANFTDDAVRIKVNREKAKRNKTKITDGIEAVVSPVKIDAKKITGGKLIESAKEAFTKAVNNETRLTINKDGSQTSSTIIEMNKEDAKDPEYVLKAHGFDPDKWVLLSAKNNFWQQAENKTMYQSKISVKPIGNNVSIEKLVEKLTQEVKPISFSSDDRLSSFKKRNLVIPLADMHFGVTKLEDLTQSIGEILEIIDSGYDTIVFEQLGDLFHSSQMNSSQTLKGTLLNEVDMEEAVSDAQSFFDILVLRAIQRSNKVLIKQMAGNHSGNLEYLFMIYLEARFPMVEVDKNIKYRTAYQLDNVGILLAHGDLAKKKLPMLFANEYSDIWANSKYREQHTGHFHKEMVEDENGVVTRQFGTPKKSDDYENKNGFTMGHKKLQILEFSQDDLKVIYNVAIKNNKVELV